MKKISFIVIALSILAIQLKAQEQTQGNSTSSAEKLQFGIKAGINRSNVYDAKGEEFKADPRYGFAGGVFLSIPIGKYLGVQPEVLFSQKGFEATGSILGSSYKFTRTTNYIDIPLLVAFKPVETITILVGPQYSYLMKQKDSFDNSIVSANQVQEFDNDNIRKNIFCFLGGFDINIDHLVIGGRVGWDVSNNNGDGTSTTPRYKNVWVQATIGIRL